MHVIGTAGHIDHGKSTLIKALTGIDPDRLKEEKDRGMTIDLGFAWITLPSGREAGIVDVPGHHRFVRNMLAGVRGIDLVVFVVAATESWMPQSQEHLDIVNLLGIRRGIVALTKADLVEDDWLAMVSEEVREKLGGTSLADAEIVPVDSLSGTGIDLLKEKIDTLLADMPEAVDRERPRLWIDRVFTIRGSGTVVTGTLEGGTFAVDQMLQVLPSGTQARVRGLQTHRKPVMQAEPGSRVAVNLAGLETEALQRGDALVLSGQHVATDIINAELRLLDTLTYELPEECELKLHTGTAELLAHVRLLDRATLAPGATGLVQIRLERAAAIDFHDRFIMRDATRQETVGGGTVLDVNTQRVRGRDLRLPQLAPGAYKVLSTAKVPVRHLDLKTLQARASAEPVELPLLILQERGWAAITELRAEVPLAMSMLEQSLTAMGKTGAIELLPNHAVHPTTWAALGDLLRSELTDFHQKYPLRPGLGRETLRSSLGIEPKLFDEAVTRLAEQGKVALAGAVLHLPGFAPTFTPVQQQEVDRLLELLAANAFSPPEIDELIGSLGCSMDIINALVDQEQLHKVGKDLVYRASTIEEAKEKITETIQAQGGIDIGAVRDILGTTRKYAVPLMEYLDQIGFTRRVGDKRILA